VRSAPPGRPDVLTDASLEIRFASADALREEFEKNIANRGIFIATEKTFIVRQAINIEIMLSYVAETNVALSLLGEVVHCIPVEMAANGAVPGVAIQFNDSAARLREAFTPLLERSAAAPPPPAKTGPRRRGSERGAVRVPTRIMPTMSPPFEATSRDLSATGILLTVKEIALPIGEVVRTCLWHPSGSPSIEIDGQVVRQVRNKSDEIAAVAIAFDRAQLADHRVSDVIEALRQAGHRSRLGSISGSIADLGLANMLQMFGTSVPQGTMVVEHEGEEGWIAFADGKFLGAELGALSGQDALVAMLAWGEGHFQFEASADQKLIGNAASASLEGVVLKAVFALDESNRASKVMAPSATFHVDVDQDALSRSSLDKTAEAVLELARTGMSIEKLMSVIPEPASEVQTSLEELIELGVLIPS
jgi:Tfp pilus assembly protein PilZ